MNTSRIASCLAALVFPVALSVAADSPPEARPTYKLRTGDKVSVAVLHEEKLRLNHASIDSNGDLYVAGLIAPVRVGGLSVADAQTSIERAYATKRLVESPRVLVAVEAYAPRSATPNQQSLQSTAPSRRG